MMTESKAILSAVDLSVDYIERLSLFRTRTFPALDGITFTIFKGETVGVVGGNGAGKSTMLKVLAGIFHPDRGKLIKNCEHVSLLSLSLGFDPYLTGRDNAVIGGMLLGASRKEMILAMPDIIEFSDLHDFIDKPLRTYSSGMSARLAFSVALTLQAEVMLVDEVLSVGDIGFQRKATQTMHDRLHSDQTVVLVSHSMEQIDSLCDRVIWLEKGKIREVGDTNSILTKYISHELGRGVVT